MSFPNITLDDTSPWIDYTGGWDTIHQGDPLVARYSNSTFHASNATGDVAVFNWTGGAIWLFGAYRLNHGFYSVSLDGAEKQYTNGLSSKDVFHQVLYTSGDITNGSHNIILTNEQGYQNTDPTLGWMDLDYIIVQGDQDQFDSKAISPTSDMITTGTPRIQAVMPTGTPQPILISSATGGSKMEIEGLLGIWLLTFSAYANTHWCKLTNLVFGFESQVREMSSDRTAPKTTIL
ncbi:uncharacterized protein IL334_000398 [Kwoniella shivajii]|uniref:Uncharacterized protein n=1 Tax=Kwoniella shivajii TaxID=564305 RepID=A0ABZ1CPL3_9TREE|nr:hypothetical protein IL334_000398 [Kwoniella shivajii]